MPSALAAARNRLATAPYPSASACFARARYRARALLSPSYAAIRLFRVDCGAGGGAAWDAGRRLPPDRAAAAATNATKNGNPFRVHMSLLSGYPIIAFL